MKKPIIFLMLILMLTFGLGFYSNINPASNAHAEKTIIQPKITAKSALLIEYNSGNVLFEKNSDERLPIASMTKLATLSVLFDAIDKGIIKESDNVVVSKTASAVGGSSAFIDAGSSYKLTDLVKTVIVASANDSSVALAEHLAGSESVFVSKMNKLAHDLGLENTNFENCTGLPIENHYSSAKDIALIYKTMCNHRLYKKYSKIWTDDFIHPSGRKTGLVNTNRLIKTFDGIEGGKTGFTNSARFCLTASANRGSMRLIGVVIGANDSKTRFAEMSELLNFGFSNYENKMVVDNDFPIAISKVKNSEKKAEIFPEHDSMILLKKGEISEFKTDFDIKELKAPLKVGDKAGKLYVFDGQNMVVDEIDLVVKNDVPEIQVLEYLKKIANNW